MNPAKRFLIIDDDADDRDLLIDALKEVDENIKCFTAANGQIALEILSNPASLLPDFIFLDLRMPKYDGKKCLNAIKNVERCKGIPVIVYTTSKNVEESNELLRMGAYRFMSKPRNSDEIYYLVSVVMEELWNSGGSNEPDSAATLN